MSNYNGPLSWRIESSGKGLERHPSTAANEARSLNARVAQCASNPSMHNRRVSRDDAVAVYEGD
jgi:hypothetical protein